MDALPATLKVLVDWFLMILGTISTYFERTQA